MASYVYPCLLRYLSHKHWNAQAFARGLTWEQLALALWEMPALTGVLRAAATVKYAWIHQQRTAFLVSRMCRLLEVSRSGYYEWLHRPPHPQMAADQQLQDKVQRSFAQGRGTYGTRRIKHLLAQEGLRVSRRRIGRLLTQAGLRCKTRRRFKAPTASGQAQTVAPNQLNRDSVG